MAYQGKFIIDNQWLAPLTIFGLGTFNAYSGNAQYRNRGGCTAIRDNGPLPAGKYWIVPRPTGGVRSAVETWLKDEFNYYSSHPTNHGAPISSQSRRRCCIQRLSLYAIRGLTHMDRLKSSRMATPVRRVLKVLLFIVLYLLSFRFVRPHGDEWTQSEMRAWMRASEVLGIRDPENLYIGLWMTIELIAALLAYAAIMKLWRYCRKNS